jgi:hypothetical protein
MQPRPLVLVGRSVTVKTIDAQPEYFTDVHRTWIGRRGRVHAIVPTGDRDNPLVKVGFDEGTQIVFYRLSELDVDPDAALEQPRKHGERASHLPKRDR